MSAAPWVRARTMPKTLASGSGTTVSSLRPDAGKRYENGCVSLPHIQYRSEMGLYLGEVFLKAGIWKMRPRSPCRNAPASMSLL